jgi:general stress protein 26
MSDDKKNLLDVANAFDTAMLVTDLGAEPNGRPMAVAGHEDDGTMWFVTSRTSPKAAEVRDDPHALVTLQSRTQYATLLGAVQIVDDKARLKQLWSKGMDLWFSGPEDPRAVLLKFSPTRGQYWDNGGLKGVKFAAEAARTLFEGGTIGQIEGVSGQATL